jgi:hypothetical protein
MGYMHMFYGLDLERLKALFGSNDQGFVAEVLSVRRQDFESNDDFFGVGTGEGGYPSSETALREMVGGTVTHPHAEALYGYVLKIICEHLGRRIGEDVYAIRDHPYQSQLLHSGPPIRIPYDESDFPEIGYLALADIPAEIARLDAAPRKARKSLRFMLLGLLFKGLARFQPSDEEVADDMAAYRATLVAALESQVSIVSFRH